MELTDLEKTLLKATSEEFKYIARDENGDLYLYTQKPFKESSLNDWRTYSYYIEFYMYSYLFQDIKWEDEEPYKFR